jgi:hypothetical protein
MLLALAHAATSELRAKHIAAAQIQPALVTTILGALGADVRGSRRLPRQKTRRET